jgi:ribA/ribD-fused uncharacterized protein
MNKEERMRQDGITEEPLCFYYPTDEHGYMSNFSPHTVMAHHPFTGELVCYQTSEHRFQAMKAMTKNDHDYVLQSADPGTSKTRGREIELRPGWGDKYGDLCWYVMFETVLAKFSQHKKIRNRLLETGGRAIWEDSPRDDIWGIRHARDYRGKNLLGYVLMDVRAILS